MKTAQDFDEPMRLRHRARGDAYTSGQFVTPVPYQDFIFRQLSPHGLGNGAEIEPNERVPVEYRRDLVAALAQDALTDAMERARCRSG